MPAGTIHGRGRKPSITSAVFRVQNEPPNAPAATRAPRTPTTPEGEHHEGEQDRPGRGRRCTGRGASRREFHRWR